MPRSILVSRLALLLAALLLAACTGTTPPVSEPELQLHPETPLTDDRDYRYMELGNGLKALLISDPDTDRAAAALTVGVGSLADPPGREGLAHFLEHMLFLGTEGYPDPDEYGDFISRHGGRHNAYTAPDHTNYFFEIAAPRLRGALDRFSQFFVAPLFDPDYVAREMNAVHSEYMLQMRDDGWRTFMVQKRAFDPGHPAARFNIGSLETLADRPDDPIRPALLEFYQRHYSADRMGLVVLGSEDLDTLAGWVGELFDAVPQRATAETEPDRPLFRDQDLPALLEVEPVRELRTLQLSFPLPPLDPLYQVAPGDFLANLVGHEGEGSLHAWLMAQGWIDGLMAGASHYGRENATFSVSIQLTETGFAHWQDVAAAVFAYIDLIAEGGIDADRYREHARLNALAFDYRERGAPLGYVRGLAHNLLRFPPQDLIRAPYAMDAFDAGLIRDFLERLRPQRALVTLIAPESETDSVEPHFQVPYRLRPLSGETLARWRNPGAHPALALPAPNPFVPEHMELLATGDDAPRSLDTTQPMTVWHMADPGFGVPRANLRIDIGTPAAADPQGRVLAAIHARLATDALTTRAYPARLAGLSYSLRGDPTGLALSLGGFDDKLEHLLEMVLETLTGLEPRADRFEHHRRELLRELRNQLEERPYQRTMAGLRHLLEIPGHETELLIGAAETVTREDLNHWRRTAFDAPGVRALIHGNLDARRAAGIAGRIADHLDPGPDDHVPEPLLVRLDASPVQRRVVVAHDDAALTRYVQGREQTWDERARFGLLGHMIGSAYFNDLRTERQLGYVVSAGAWVRVNTPGLFFLVQSPVASPADLETATREFLTGFRQRLATLGPEDFENEREGLLARLLERDRNLSDRSARLWRDIQDEITTFDSRERLAEAIRAVDLDDFRRFYDDFLVLAGERVASVWSSGGFDPETAAPEGLPVLDLETFKAGRDHFRPGPVPDRSDG